MSPSRPAAAVPASGRPYDPRVRPPPPAAAVLLAAAAIAGCGPDTTPEGGVPAPPPTAPVPAPPPAAPGVTGIEPPPAPATAGVEFGAGWQPEERTGAGTPFRWMGTRASLTVRGSGARRLEFAASTLARPRTLTVRLGRRVVARAELPRVGARRLRVRLPARLAAARLVLVASPGASPASEVSPRDDRLLAVQVSDVTLEPAG